MDDLNENVKSLASFVDLWYRGLCPTSIGSNDLIRFFVNSRGTLIKNLLDAYDELPNILVKPGELTASTDLKQIFIPALVFTPEFFAGFGIEDVDDLGLAAMGVLNWFLIHEAAHIKYTEKTISQAVEYIRSKAESSKIALAYLATNTHFAALLNIFEDAYIESCVKKHYPKHYLFVDAARKNIVQNKTINDRAKLGILANPTLLNLIQSLTLLISQEIGQDYIEFVTNLLGGEIVGLFTQSYNTNLTQNERIDIVWEIFGKLWDMELNENAGESGESGEITKSPANNQQKGQTQENTGDEKSEENEADAGEGDEQKLGRDEILNDGNADTLGRYDRLGENTNISKEQMAEEQEISQEYREEMAKANKENREHEVKTKFRQLDGSAVETVRIDYQDIVNDKNAFPRINIEPHRDFLRIGTLLRHIRAVKTDFGIARNKGRKLAKHDLHRIITDSKILKRVDARHKKTGNPEVILLADVSGSTFSGLNRNINNLCYQILSSCFGAYLSLRRAQIPVSVYAHSTNDRISVVRGIASYKMPLNGNHTITTENNPDRFSRAFSMRHNCNADGDAIAHVAKLFSNSDCPKILIVLSDGMPTLYPDFINNRMHDSLRVGEYWTKMNVDKLREQGIVVFSISLATHVVRNNNKIYGEKFNIDATNNLMRKMQEMVMQLGLNY